jgi:hypothetical protein
MMSESHGPSFEYDEASDEGDESFEASDEGDESFEASDEGDESFEASDEGDESFEASDEALREGDEASDEGARIPREASDEAVSLSSRYAAAREREKQQRLAAQLAADLRSDRNQATAVQRSVNNRLRDIGTSAQVKTLSVGAVRGASIVRLTLPTGRSTSASISPSYVTAEQFNRQMSVSTANDRRLSGASAAIKRDVRRLAAAQKVFVSQETAARVKSDKVMSLRLKQIATSWDKRFRTELAGQKGAITKNNRMIRKRIQETRRRAVAQSLTLTGAIWASRVYGNSKLTSFENLTVAGSTVGWLLAPVLLDQFRKSRRSGGEVATVANGAAYVGPLANPATIALMLRNRQRERFVAGIADGLAAGTLKQIPLNIGSGTLDDLKKAGKALPAVATVVAGGNADNVVLAEVVDGSLNITITGTVSAATRVAFAVDTMPA